MSNKSNNISLVEQYKTVLNSVVVEQLVFQGCCSTGFDTKLVERQMFDIVIVRPDWSCDQTAVGGDMVVGTVCLFACLFVCLFVSLCVIAVMQ